jgi:hypothetical protein
LTSSTVPYIVISPILMIARTCIAHEGEETAGKTK